MAEPIILDETAKAINEELAEYNTWLNVIASRKIPELYTNPAAMASMIRKGTVESNKKLFPVGDKIIVPWKDMDDPNHNTDQTAYKIPFRIVHHDMVERADGMTVPGMYLQSTVVFPYCMPSHAGKYTKILTEPMPAGDYYFTVNEDIVYGNEKYLAGTSYNFRTYRVSEPGSYIIIALQNSPNAFMGLGGGYCDTGVAGTFIGGINKDTVSDEGLLGASSVWIPFKWETSLHRAYMNDSSSNWVDNVEKSENSIPISNVPAHGLLYGFDEDFLSSIKKIRTKTLYNNSIVDTYDYMFSPSLSQAYLRTEQPEESEFEYYKRFLKSKEPIEFKYGYEWPRDLIGESLDPNRKRAISSLFRTENKHQSNPGRLIYTHRYIQDSSGTLGDSNVDYSSITDIQYDLSPCCCIC